MSDDVQSGHHKSTGSRDLPSLGVVRRFLQMPALFAIAIQGFSGLIQVAAFSHLTGQAFLDFNTAFLIGTIISLVAGLNLENSILGRDHGRSTLRYFIIVWLIGLVALAFDLGQGHRIPNVIAFVAWGVCSRLFLAWASSAAPRFWVMAVVGLGALGLTWWGYPTAVMALGLLSMPFLASTRITPHEDDGFWLVVRGSALAFGRFLPHILAGLAIGYLDRFLAISVIGGHDGELYLRTVQVVSWSAFICFPLMFQLRSRIIKQDETTAAQSATAFVTLSGGLGIALAGVISVLLLSGAPYTADLSLLLLVFAAIALSQLYQVTSPLNFIRKKFGTVNAITLTSAAASCLVALALVTWWRDPHALAIMLLVGWSTQVAGTLFTLLPRTRHEPG